MKRKLNYYIIPATMILKYLRKKTRPILIGTLLLIIPAFIFLYGWSRISDNSGAIPQVIAKVGKTPITYTDYQLEFQEYMSYLGKFYSEDVAKRVRRQVLESFIQRCLLEEEAKKRKIIASDDEIVRQIRGFFKDEAGQFDSKSFLSVSNRYPERIKLLEESVRMQIILERLRNEITSPVKVSDEEIHQYFLTSEAEAKIKSISISPESLRRDVETSENELMEYYEKNKEGFKNGPWAKIEYIFIGEDLIKEDINADNGEKEQMLEDKAFQISLKVLGEDDWKAFVQKEGLIHGITGYFSQDEPIDEFNGNLAVNEAVFATAPNEVSEPLKAEKGYIIFRRQNETGPQYEEISDKIRKIVEDEKIKDLSERRAEEILSVLQSGKSEEDISRNYALTIKESNYFSRNGFIEGIGYAPDVAQVAFATAQNNWAKVTGFGGEIFIIATTDIKQPSEEKFPDKKDSIATLLLNQKRQEFFMDWVEELREKNKNRIVIFWEKLKDN